MPTELHFLTGGKPLSVEQSFEEVGQLLSEAPWATFRRHPGGGDALVQSAAVAYAQPTSGKPSGVQFT